ncbi:MAG TPA: helix-turn-helix domain-containing protein, partial [Candidatus Baltobacteraceae bacterium]
GRDRVLICLAVNGPMHVRAIARTVRMDPHKVWSAVERLTDSGLVVKRDQPGGRKYVALNRRLPLYRSLLSLLVALDAHWPVSRVEREVTRWYMPFDNTMDARRLDTIFHSDIRSRTLTFIAAVGRTNLSTIYKSLGLGMVSTMYVVNFWVREGALRSSHIGNYRVIELDPEFIVANELAAFLRAIVASSSEYDALRTAARRRLRPFYKYLEMRAAATRKPPAAT